MMDMREEALWIIHGTIEDVMPEKAVREALADMALTGQVYVAAVGKAAWTMAAAASDVLGKNLKKGIVVTKYHHSKGEIPGFVIIESGHPTPDENSVSGAREVIRMIESADEKDTVLFLLSGGGSSLLELPAQGLSLEDIQETTQKFLRSGAGITQINVIRKRLSAVKGGKLTSHLRTEHAYSIILSDIIGDQADMIASGLTYPDRSTSEEALNIIRKYKVEIPERVAAVLKKAGGCLETRVENHVVGSVEKLCQAAAHYAKKMGYHPYILTSSLQCEAADAGIWLASMADHAEYHRPFALIAGGETVVKVTGNGTGGRNQELALSGARLLEGKKNVLLFSFGSDGTDGPTDAAGGIVDGETCCRLRALGIDVGQVLQENDSYHALQAADGLIETGATGTNVNDVAVLLVK